MHTHERKHGHAHIQHACTHSSMLTLFIHSDMLIGDVAEIYLWFHTAPNEQG